jgi:hypothetical protein
MLYSLSLLNDAAHKNKILFPLNWYVERIPVTSTGDVTIYMAYGCSNDKETMYLLISKPNIRTANNMSGL